MKLIESMLSAPFEQISLHPKSLMQRILRQEPPDNAIIEVNNLLADRDILSLKKEEFQEIEKRYAISLNEFFLLNLLEFYAVLYNYFLTISDFSESEWARLHHLQKLFDLGEDMTQYIRLQLGLPFFRRELAAALGANGMSVADRIRLSEMPGKIGIASPETDVAVQDIKQKYIHEYILKSESQTRWSPEDAQHLDQLCIILDVTMTGQDREAIDKYLIYWGWENQRIDPVAVRIVLQKNETCLSAFEDVEWYEERAVHRRDDSIYLFDQRLKKYTLSIPFEEPQKQFVPLLKYIDSGNVYLTNKRVIFSGIEKETSFKWQSIEKLNLFDGAVEVVRKTGRNPFFFFSENEHLFVLGTRFLRDITDPATP